MLACPCQLTQANSGKFNVHVHVEYEWRLHNDDLDESEDELDEKVSIVDASCPAAAGLTL